MDEYDLEYDDEEYLDEEYANEEYDEDEALGFEYGYRYEEEEDLNPEESGFMRGYVEA